MKKGITFGIVSLMTLKAASLAAFDELKTTSQDLFINTTMCQEKEVCPYLEVSAGYRYDKIDNQLELVTGPYTIDGGRLQKMQFSQLNFKGGIRFKKYLFLKGLAGLGFLSKDTDYEQSHLKNTTILVNQYTKTFDRGFGQDYVFGGGFHIPFFKKYFSFDPEIGYMFKKVRVNNSLKTRISGGYVGGTVYFSPGYHIGLSFYGDYVFAPGRMESGYLYIVNTDSFLRLPEIESSSNINAYKLAASISYLFSKNISINFNWERFSASTGTEHGTLVPGVKFSQTQNFWHSNQFVFGVRYSF
jgi:hypothetical protein